MFAFGLAVGLVLGWFLARAFRHGRRILRRLMRKPTVAPIARTPTDEALIVELLAVKGRLPVYRIRGDMEDVTRGRVDWLMKDEREIYRALNRLEQDGTVRRVSSSSRSESDDRSGSGVLSMWSM